MLGSTSKNLRPAGQSTRELSDRRYKARVRFMLPLMAGVLLMAAFLLHTSGWRARYGLIGSGVFVAVAVGMRMLMNYGDAREKKMKREEQRAARGAEGEEAIGRILDSLGDDYLVVHDVESAHGNIDHIVIADHGSVFLIETKAHGGRATIANGQLLVNGHEPEKNFISQTLRNTYWLRDRLQEATGMKIWITPLVVFTNAFVERSPALKGVRILNKKYLLSFLKQAQRMQQSNLLWEKRKEIRSILLQPLRPVSEHTPSYPFEG